ncbi:transposase [Facklamia miroungae]|uniref:transposase n=1 Tax=Facklamia miroungae TaxID=120956 RepID=UPI003CCB8B21
MYGYRRITIYLNYYHHAKVNHKYVCRLMKLMGLQAVIHRKIIAIKRFAHNTWLRTFLIASSTKPISRWTIINGHH